MPQNTYQKLSRRERQIMDILIEHQRCSAGDIQKALPDPPGYSAVRALLARLVEKDAVQYIQSGAKYVYSPKIEPEKAQQSAVTRLLKTFFKGSRVNAVNALLDAEGEAMDTWEIEKLERRIAQLKNNKAQIK